MNGISHLKLELFFVIKVCAEFPTFHSRKYSSPPSFVPNPLPTIDITGTSFSSQKINVASKTVFRTVSSFIFYGTRTCVVDFVKSPPSPSFIWVALIFTVLPLSHIPRCLMTVRPDTSRAFCFPSSLFSHSPIFCVFCPFGTLKRKKVGTDIEPKRNKTIFSPHARVQPKFCDWEFQWFISK